MKIVCVPNVPNEELDVLEAHWQEANRDPNYSAVVNYAIYVVDVPNPNRTIISALDVDSVTLNKLRTSIMNSGPESVVFVNYKVYVSYIR